MSDQLRALFEAPLPPYQRRRIIVWKDEAREFQDAIKEQVPQGVQLLVMAKDNHFLIRQQLEEEYAQEDILLYCPLTFRKPEDNWLLDVFLYSPEYRADYWSRLLAELNIPDGPPLRAAAQEYAPFFKSQERRAKFIALGVNFQQPRDVRDAVFSACCGLPSASLAGVVQAVLSGNLQEVTNLHLETIEKYCGPEAFWQAVAADYGFEAARTPMMLCAHLLFSAASLNLNANTLLGLPFSASRAAACYALFGSWHRDDPEGLLKACREVQRSFDVTRCLGGADQDSLLRCAVFPLVDELLLSRAFYAYAEGTLRPEDAQALLDARPDKPWYPLAAQHYEALSQIMEMEAFHAAQFRSFRYTSTEAAWKQYVQGHYRMDTAYRRFFTAFDRALSQGASSADDELKAAAEAVDRLYKNWFLQELGSRWSDLVYTRLAEGEVLVNAQRQERFYSHWVAGKGKRVFVIISDALRYELGQELAEALNSRLSGQAECEAMLGVFPSTTRFGMAALLPHRHLSLTDKLQPLCDGLPATAQGREAILKATCPESVVLHHDDFKLMNRKQRAQAIKDSKVVYLYHNVVDRTGEHDERGVFAACQTAVAEISQMVSALVHELSASLVLITTDHGFLYNNAPLEEADKAERDFIQGTVLEYKRRYAIVQDAQPTQETLAQSLGDYGRPELNALAPRANIRFKLSGAGINYVHGGLALQEICLPVVCYQHRRAGQLGFQRGDKTDLQLVDAGRKISNNIFTLRFLQTMPVSDKTLARTVEAWFEDDRGQTISDRLRIIADKTNPANNERMISLTFRLLGTGFDSRKDYHLVVWDAEDQVILQRIPFSIEIAFGQDFGWS